jgi:hypothetical protein
MSDENKASSTCLSFVNDEGELRRSSYDSSSVSTAATLCILGESQFHSESK